MKFKVGDKVVRIKRDDEVMDRFNPKTEYAVGESFVIESIVPWGVVFGDKNYGCGDDEVELESVYNSKLYKSLT